LAARAKPRSSTGPKIKARGEIRTQFHHVIDIAPTILEAAVLPEPLFVNGVQQHPIEGVSMLYAFDDAKASERREAIFRKCRVTGESITQAGPP
jgi:arylsulfatase A-like enzyme